MKAGIVYTTTTPALVRTVNAELRKTFGENIEILNYQDESILREVGEQGHMTASAAARLVSLFMQAIRDGADAVLNCCSTVGEVVDASQGIAQLTGVPIVRIDEDMCRQAVLLGNRIGIIATLASTMEPTRKTVLRMASEMNRQVTTVDCVMEGAFGAGQDVFRQMICDTVAEIIDRVDVILLAQGSMAYAEEMLAEKFKKPVLSSPRCGVAALAKALEARKVH